MSPLKPHFSLTKRAGGFVFVSGQLPFGDDGRIVDGDIAVQTRRCIENLRSALKTEGLDLRHVVKVTVWLTRPADFPAFNAAYADLFGGAPPARTTVGSALMVDGALIEMEAQAYAGD